MDTTVSALDLIRQTFAHRPCGLMTDIDGTLSPIADTPDSARVKPEAITALRKLTCRIDMVAAVSGRSAHDARQMVTVDELVYSGNHGMELWIDGQLEQSPTASLHRSKISEILSTFEERFNTPGLLVENKGLTGSIHYRETDDPNSVQREIMRIIRPLAEKDELRITEGRMVIEIRPPVELNKGTSAIDLIDRFALISGVFIGDDVTDVDAFQALRNHRASTGQHFYAIGVSSDETPQSVIDYADALVHGVDGVVELLRAAGEIGSEL